MKNKQIMQYLLNIIGLTEKMNIYATLFFILYDFPSKNLLDKDLYTF